MRGKYIYGRGEMVSWRGKLGGRCNNFNLLACQVGFYGRDKLISGRRALVYGRGHYMYGRGEIVFWRGKVADRRVKFNLLAWPVGLRARGLSLEGVARWCMCGANIFMGAARSFLAWQVGGSA